MKYSWQHWLIVLIFWGGVLAPVGVYAYQFGFGVWNSNQDWANMGSAIGGLYTPILSFFTIFIIGMQLWRQNQSEAHNQMLWFIDRNLIGGNKALKNFKDYLNMKDVMGALVSDGFATAMLEYKRGVDLEAVKKLIIESAIHELTMSCAGTYFLCLENLKRMNNPYCELAYQELRNDGVMMFGSDSLSLFETHLRIEHGFKFQHFLNQ